MNRLVVVVGLGASGEAAALLCKQKGAHVVANDARDRAGVGEAMCRRLESAGIALALGGHDRAGFSDADLIVVSPGVPNLPELRAAERRGIRIVGELELASWWIDAEIVAIGGTNGKSTTTELCAALAETSGRPVFAGGNLGVPVSRAVLDAHPGVGAGGLAVLEVSSFQLERVAGFRPRASILLNITPDHLDRYPSFEAYANAKGGAFRAQIAEDFAIVPHGDPLVARIVSLGGGTLDVCDGPRGEASIGLEGESIVDYRTGVSMPRAALRLAGRHNVQNVCAAWAAMRDVGLDTSRFPAALAAFSSLAHRVERIAEIGGVTFYDDSKGTNVGASVTALRGLAERFGVLIAGGKDKGGSYAPLIEALASRGRALVTIGEASPLIEAEAARGLPAGFPVVSARDMADAVTRAAALAQPGDAVLLSPACSSFDMFRDYKHRGEVFAAEVRRLAAAPPNHGKELDP